MNVCILTSSFPRTPEDPAGIFIYNLAKWLAKKDIDVIVLAPHDKGCRLYEIRDNIRIYRFPYFFPFRFQKLCYGAGILKNLKKKKLLYFQIPFFLIAEIISTFLIAIRLKPPIIHSHWSIPQGITGVITSKLLHIPCITTLHGSDVFGLQKSFLTLLNRETLRHSNICTANSKKTVEAAQWISGKKNTILIPMGVDTDFFKKMREKKENNGKAILFVGRLIDLKGVDYLIAALKEVLVKFPDTKLYIVGDGPKRGKLEILAKRLQLADNVIFTGSLSQNKLRSYYSLADVFVLPSIVHDTGETEGMGVVLLEAMSAGVPVIGSDVGGIGDIIKHEITGLLVPQKQPETIGEEIIRLFENHRLRSNLVENGRQMIETHFSWDVVSDKFIRLYKNIT